MVLCVKMKLNVETRSCDTMEVVCKLIAPKMRARIAPKLGNMNFACLLNNTLVPFLASPHLQYVRVMRFFFKVVWTSTYLLETLCYKLGIIREVLAEKVKDMLMQRASLLLSEKNNKREQRAE